MRALLYLTFCSMKNRVRARLRRLRQPRYLAGFIAGLLYFYFLLWPGGGSGRRSAGVLSFIAGASASIEVAMSAALFLIAALAWLWPGSGRPALAFTRADVQFLFPAPFTRRQLIGYKVFQSQLAALIGSAMVTVFFRPTSLVGGWMFFAGTSMLMATLNVHLTGVSLSRESVSSHGRFGVTRQWVPVALVLGSVVALAATIAADWPRLATLEWPRQIGEELQRICSTGLAGLVLWPFRALVRLPLAASPLEFLRALPGATLLLALNVLWVVRSDAAFEEASAELAERVARLRRGQQPVVRRARQVRTPFTLALTGRPETALVWKNLILLGRYPTWRVLLFLLPIVVIAGTGVMNRNRGSHTETVEFVAFLCVFLSAMTILLGPLMIRNDLRKDLANLPMLKAWPIRGAAIVRGEVLAPTLVLSVVVWGLILSATALSAGLIVQASVSARLLFGIGARSIADLTSYAAAAMILAPGLIAVNLVAQNGIAVLFPAWVTIGTPRSQGVEVMGQRILLVFGSVLALVGAVLPAAVAGGLAGGVVYLVLRIVPVVVPAAIGTAVLLAECVLATEALGSVLDRTDLTAIDAPE